MVKDGWTVKDGWDYSDLSTDRDYFVKYVLLSECYGTVSIPVEFSHFIMKRTKILCLQLLL